MATYFYKPNMFSFQVKLLTFSGMWLPIHESKNKRFYLYHIIFFVIYTEIYYNLSEYIVLKDIYKNLDEAIEHIGMLIQHLVGSVKIFLHLYKIRQIQSIMLRLEDDEFKYESYKDFKPDVIKQEYKSFSNRISMMWWTLVNCVPLSKILPAIIPIVFNWRQDYNCSDLLPYYSWFPFDISTQISCFWAYFIQIWPMMIYAWHIATSDIIFMCLILNTASHFIILQGVFRTLRQRCLHRLNIQNGNFILHDEDVIELNKEMMSECKRAIRYLQKLLEISEEIEDIFRYVTLCQALMSLFAIVSCMYMVSSVNIFSTAMFGNFTYLTAVACQLALYCFSGNIITFASMGVKESIYECDWFAANKMFKKDLLFTMLRLEKPVYITIGKFTPLTLSTLVSIFRASYSFLAVLKKSNTSEY